MSGAERPALRLHEESDEPRDELVEAAIRALDRPIGGLMPWGPVRLALVGAATGGLLPLWHLARRIRDYAIVEQQQLWHAAEWTRLRRGPAGDASLSDEADRLRPAAWTVWLPLLAAALAFAVAMRSASPNPVPRVLYGIAYQFPEALDVARSPALSSAAWLYAALVTGGYVVCLIALRRHAARVRAWTRRFLGDDAPSDAAPARLAGSLHLGRLLAAAPVAAAGGLWALPMALAAGSVARYVGRTSFAARGQIARALRQEMGRVAPDVRPPATTMTTRRCATAECRASLPAGARFCPRCGRAVGGAWTVVA